MPESDSPRPCEIDCESTLGPTHSPLSRFNSIAVLAANASVSDSEKLSAGANSMSSAVCGISEESSAVTSSGWMSSLVRSSKSTRSLASAVISTRCSWRISSIQTAITSKMMMWKIMLASQLGAIRIQPRVIPA